MTKRKSLVLAGSVLGFMVVGCEEKKAPPPKVTTPPAPKAPSGAPGVTAPSGAVVPTTPPPAGK
jgi:hypothetical protein